MSVGSADLRSGYLSIDAASNRKSVEIEEGKWT